MTFEEWSTCDEAWWVYNWSDRAAHVCFAEPPRNNNSYLWTRCDGHGNPWGYYNDVRIGHWFATADESRFYLEVLR